MNGYQSRLVLRRHLEGMRQHRFILGKLVHGGAEDTRLIACLPSQGPARP